MKINLELTDRKALARLLYVCALKHPQGSAEFNFFKELVDRLAPNRLYLECRRGEVETLISISESALKAVQLKLSTETDEAAKIRATVLDASFQRIATILKGKLDESTTRTIEGHTPDGEIDPAQEGQQGSGRSEDLSVGGGNGDVGAGDQQTRG